MRIKNWKINFYCLSFFIKKDCIHDRGVRFCLFDIYITDLSGKIIIFNCVITWSKMFRRKNESLVYL